MSWPLLGGEGSARGGLLPLHAVRALRMERLLLDGPAKGVDGALLVGDEAAKLGSHFRRHPDRRRSTLVHFGLLRPPRLLQDGVHKHTCAPRQAAQPHNEKGA